MRRLGLLLAAALAAFSCQGSGSNGPPVCVGELVASQDPSFGSGGWVLGSNFGPATSLSRLADGDLLAGGTGVARLTSNGVFRALFSLPGPLLAVSSDGSFAAAGPGGSTVARFLPNGLFDPSFGAGGTATIPITVGGLLALPGGGLLVAGQTASASTGALLRLDTHGSPDPLFGAGGLARVAPLAGWSVVVGTTLAVRTDGAIALAGGYSLSGTNFPYPFLALFDTSGQLLRPVSAPPFGPGPRAAAFDREGRVLVAGVDVLLGLEGLVQRFDLSGAPDLVFSTSYGTVRVGSLLSAVLPLPDGRLFIGGKDGGSAGTGLLVARLLDDGSFDPSFAEGCGAVSPRFGPSGQTAGLVLDSQGRLLVVGGEGSRFAMVRLVP